MPTVSCPGLALFFGLICGRIAQLVLRPRRALAPAGRRQLVGKGVAVVGAAVLVILSMNFWTDASTVYEDLPGLACYVADNVVIW